MTDQPSLLAMASPVKAISFTINGQKVDLSDPSPQTSLNEWIRSQYGLTGTKRMCGEGGCGCCVVSLTRTDLLSNKQVTLAINSVSDSYYICIIYIIFTMCILYTCSVCVLYILLMAAPLLQSKELEGKHYNDSIL